MRAGPCRRRSAAEFRAKSQIPSGCESVRTQAGSVHEDYESAALTAELRARLSSTQYIEKAGRRCTWLRKILARGRSAEDVVLSKTLSARTETRIRFVDTCAVAVGECLQSDVRHPQKN